MLVLLRRGRRKRQLYRTHWGAARVRVAAPALGVDDEAAAHPVDLPLERRARPLLAHVLREEFAIVHRPRLRPLRLLGHGGGRR